MSRYWLGITVIDGATMNSTSEYEFIIIGMPHAAAILSECERLNAASWRMRFQPVAFHGASPPMNFDCIRTEPAISPPSPSAPQTPFHHFIEGRFLGAHD